MTNTEDPDIPDTENPGPLPVPATFGDELADGPLLRADEVARLTSLHPKTIARLVEQERFPAPLQLSERRRAWKRRDMRAWLADPYGWVNF